MSLGLCCQYLEPRIKRDGSVEYVNSINEKALRYGQYQAGRYSKKLIHDVYVNNLQEIVKVIPKIVADKIQVFRLSSDLFPLLEYNQRLVGHSPVVQSLLKQVGDMFKQHNIRVTTHPSQFVVLSSDSKHTVTNSIKVLELQAWIFDLMGFQQSPYAAINIHGGKSDRTDQLIASINSLGSNVRSRLTLENDESAYGVMDLLPVHEATGVPIVFDSHHHTFRTNNLSMDDAYDVAISTWNNLNCKPLQHISNTSPELANGNFLERKKHSQYIHTIPDCQREGLIKDIIDVEVEAKMKNLAILSLDL